MTKLMSSMPSTPGATGIQPVPKRHMPSIPTSSKQPPPRHPIAAAALASSGAPPRRAQRGREPFATGGFPLKAISLVAKGSRPLPAHHSGPSSPRGSCFDFASVAPRRLGNEEPLDAAGMLPVLKRAHVLHAIPPRLQTTPTPPSHRRAQRGREPFATGGAPLNAISPVAKGSRPLPVSSAIVLPQCWLAVKLGAYQNGPHARRFATISVAANRVSSQSPSCPT
jgi:hypothetical protein